MKPFAPNGLRNREVSFVLALVAVALIANACLAAWIGYLSPDSWNYLRLAKGFWTTGFPSINHTYFAVFPFGYPALLALASPGLDLVQTMIASKFVNAGLWIAVYLLLRRLRVHPLAAAALVLNPFALWIGALTWSENLMILAFVLTLAGIDAVEREERRGTAILLSGLVLGLLSRYVFGFVIVSVVIAYWLAYRHAARRRVFISLAASCALYGLYLLANLWLIGHSTGLERVPSFDSFGFLLFTFLSANAESLLEILLSVAFVALIAARNWRMTPLALMTGLIGLAYLAIITGLRLRSHFDPFDERLLGPGWFLLALALALMMDGAFTAMRAQVGLVALLALAFGSAIYVHGPALQDLADRKEIWTSPVAEFAGYRSPLAASDTLGSVISIDTPSPRASIKGDNPLYYGDLDVFMPGVAPFVQAETLAGFRERLLKSGANLDRCVIDYSRFATEEELSDTIYDEYRSGFLSAAPIYDEALADRFHDLFRPNAYIPCKDFIRD